MAMLAAAAFVVAVGVVTGMPGSTSTPVAMAEAGDGEVTIRVVQEMNANGLVDSEIAEPPLAGVTVLVSDAFGNEESVVTDASGVATFDAAASSLVGGQYRVTAVNPDPAMYEPSFAANGQSPEAEPIVGADLMDPANAKLSTSTEFVDVSPDPDTQEPRDAFVNFAFWEPDMYCQLNAPVAGACQTREIFSPQTEPEGGTLFTVPYQLGAAPTDLATKADTGNVYGIAWDKQTRRVFSSASAKRGSAYGPLGSGGIYVTDYDAGTTTPFATVPNAGTTAHDMDTVQDEGFFDVVGKESLGELEITNDGRFLFTVNLADKSVYVYDATLASADAPVSTISLPNPCANAADWRPYGLGVGRSTEYVGGVCTGQSTQSIADMSAHIWELDVEAGTLGAEVLTNGFDFFRGEPYNFASACSGHREGDPAGTGRFYPWIDAFPYLPNEQDPDGCPGGNTAYPQPILADIIEETNGDLIVSFRDRMGDQSYNGTQNTDHTDPNNPVVRTNAVVAAGGDILRGCRLGDGTFVLDPLFDPGTHTLADGAVCTDNNDGVGDDGGQTDIFREYYSGEGRVGGIHQESSFSGMALSRGEETVISSAIDPSNDTFTNGVLAVNRDGTNPGAPEGVVHPAAGPLFGKSAGMADLEVLCDMAPVQIGNRVWLDVDSDGVQDPGEEPIAGVTVNLYDDGGALVGTTVTNEHGTYLFDDSNVDVDGDGLLPETEYVVRVDNPVDYEPDGPLELVTPTLPNVGDDQFDSDGVVADDGFPETSVTTGGPGQNDHAHDFGFSLPSVSVGDLVWVDTDRDGQQDDGEPGIADVELSLVGPDGEPVTDVNGDPVGPVVTDANGEYEFSDLPVLEPGESYTVIIDEESPALEPYLPTTPNTGDPASDSSTGSATSGDLTEDGDRDPTLDFGFVEPSVSVGDLVWVDTDRDGQQDPGEPGIPGVELTLVGPDGEPVTDVFGDPVGPVTTDENGEYDFSNLPVLEPGESYTVTIDEDSPALEPYMPTTPNTGDPASDSSTGSASSGDLTSNGDRDPTLDFGFVEPSVSVGDLVWVDTDRDGRQDPGEPGIPGVELTLVGPDGEPVTDVFGDPVGPVVTDENGEYEFSDLPVLEPGESYTVIIDEDSPALEPYMPTVAGQGNRSGDSSTGSASSGDLTSDGDRDPTLDFGFVEPSVSVGDLVWVDSDGDGQQDPGEPGIPDVELTLVGPDGEPVTDVFGDPVGPVVTDENGEYDFSDLPVLEPGESYTVIIDQDSPALAPYIPTTPNTGNPDSDSSTGSASSGDLTEDGDRDPTLDFGFVEPPPATDPPATDPPATDPPATDPPATDPPPVTQPPVTQPPPATDPPVTELPGTGGDVMGILKLAGMLVIVGSFLVLYRKRRRTVPA